MALSFVEIDGQRLEPLPTRTVLSPFNGGHDYGGASGGSY